MKGNLLSCAILLSFMTITLTGYAYQPAEGTAYTAVPDSTAFRGR